ncbi:MAG: IS21 family transposase [Pseudobdellovibrionaceae bacterium]
MAQYEDIKQKIEQGLSDRQIAKSLGKRRSTISEIRKGLYKFEEQQTFPDWMQLLNWDEILKEIGLKHPISFIWEESAKELTSYSNFIRYLYKKFPYLKYGEYTHRQFNPGERVEVDWAGDVVEWIEPKSGKIHKSYIFIGCLGYSQLIFARAYSSMKEIDFLSAHEAMFSYYDGVPEVICPDNTKTAVIKSNKYDPDLNQEYNRFTKHYGITVAPARVYSPKDKALVEGAVKLVQRYFRWRNRKVTFTSPTEINTSLQEICEIINNKVHTRFKISRREMFNLEEKSRLKPLPEIKYELCESKFAKVHPDGTVCVNLRYYSVPYRLVGESVFVKIFANTLEIYHKLEKVAIHPRLFKYKGEKSIFPEHIPEASQAYQNTNVQFLLQQSMFIDPEFRTFIENLLKESPCGNLRKAQGFIREARTFKGKVSSEIFKIAMVKTLSDMQRYNHIRVETFKNYMRAHFEVLIEKPSMDQIKRDLANPMLRKNQTIH